MTSDDPLADVVDAVPVRIVLELQRWDADLADDPTTVQDVTRAVETSYSHATKIVSALASAGYVEKEPKGRSMDVSLTDRGRRVAERLRKLPSEVRDAEAET